MIGPVYDEDYLKHLTKLLLLMKAAKRLDSRSPSFIKTKELIFKFVCLYISGSMSSQYIMAEL